MTQKYDVVVAGGGPSGAAAAWQAAQTGAQVIVLDKAEFPRDKPCGYGFSVVGVLLIEFMVLC
jgi:flavin-dependent dehydrogenase